MTKEEKLEKIKGMRHYFWASFWISFIFMIIATLITIVFYDFHSQMVLHYFHLDRDSYSKVLVMVLSIWKILIIQFTLIPAIVLSIMSKHCCCHSKENP